jgi:hypothetical protein
MLSFVKNGEPKSACKSKEQSARDKGVSINRNAQNTMKYRGDEGYGRREHGVVSRMEPRDE